MTGRKCPLEKPERSACLPDFARDFGVLTLVDVEQVLSPAGHCGMLGSHADRVAKDGALASMRIY